MGFAVLIPLVTLGDDGRDHLLLEVRSMSVAQPGEICFPGGRMEAGETVLEAALRETCEELGVAPDSVEILGELEPVRMVTGRAPRLIVGL